jgi:regulation of enolase protein 1 (concanavalin A-like superfamily)
MAKTISAIVLGFGAFLIVARASADDAKTLGSQWGALVDPDKDCRTAEKDGVLTITVPGTHHNLTHTPTGTRLNSPRVLKDVKGDFRAQVTVKAFPLPAPNTSVNGGFSFISAGLLVWQDDKQFVRLDRAAEGGTQESPFAWVEVFEGGKSVKRQFRAVPNKDTFLRITRAGNKLTFETSEDGKDWGEVMATDVKLAEGLKVGVLAINTTTREFGPHFEGLTITAK